MKNIANFKLGSYVNIFLYDKKWHYFFFALIAGLNIFIYFPSFFHIARSDQLPYFLDTSNTHGWLPTILNFFSYNRVRLVNIGDRTVFRPIFFILIETERWLFGYNFIFWQIFGVFLHLVLIWWLLKILLHIYPSILAYFFALFFSTLSTIQEMVIWHHINAYILFLIFILIALYYLRLFTEEGRTKLRYFLVIALCLLLACFIYDVGQFFAIMFSVYIFLFRTKKNKAQLNWKIALLFITPAILYIYTNRLDISLRDPSIFQEQRNFAIQLWDLSKVINHFIRLIVSWICFGLFPNIFPLQLQKAYFGERAHNVINWEHIINGFTIADMINIVAVVILVFAFIKSTSFSILKSRWKFNLLIISKILIFTTIIVLGRTIERGILIILSFSSYNSYFIWIFFIIIIYSLIDINQLKHQNKYIKLILITSFVFLIVLNCYNVYCLNLNYAKSLRPNRIFVEQLNKFVNAHKKEPSFSFKFSQHPLEDEIVQFIRVVPKEGSHLKKTQDYYYSEIIYYSYINEENPKYILNVIAENQ